MTTRDDEIIEASYEFRYKYGGTEEYEGKDAFIHGADWADAHPANKGEYTALQWPEIQEYMESPRWKEVGYDPKKDLWFVPKDMIK